MKNHTKQSNKAKLRRIALVGVASLLVTLPQQSLGVDYASNIKLPESLKKLVAERQGLLVRAPYCIDGCKEFIVTCERQVKANRIDNANGITEHWVVGTEYLSFNRHHNKYYGGSDLVSFSNTKSGWVMGPELAGETKNCRLQR